MSYDLIYVNGDSYVSATREFKIYGEHIADFFDSEIINRAVPGSANSRIFRTSLRDLIDLKNSHAKILACISLSFLIRTDLWDPLHNFDKWRNTNDGDFMCIQPMTSDNWISNKKNFFNKEFGEYDDFCKQYVNWYDVESETVRLLEKIILFANWCENNDVDYIIFSPMYQETVDFSAPFISNFYEEIRQNKKILDLFEFSFLDWCLKRNHKPIDSYFAVVGNKQYQVGHMGASGHEDFAKFLLEKYFTVDNL